jgi:hypothetical protein
MAWKRSSVRSRPGPPINPFRVNDLRQVLHSLPVDDPRQLAPTSRDQVLSRSCGFRLYPTLVALAHSRTGSLEQLHVDRIHRPPSALRNLLHVNLSRSRRLRVTQLTLPVVERSCDGRLALCGVVEAGKVDTYSIKFRRAISVISSTYVFVQRSKQIPRHT